MQEPKIDVYKLTHGTKEEFDYSHRTNNINLIVSSPEKYKPLLNDYILSFFNHLLKSTKDINIYTKEILAHLSNIVSKSQQYRNKLLSEILRLNPNQLGVFLESERYNNFSGKKYNPFLEIIRIRNGLLTHDVVSFKSQLVCDATIGGFLSALESKTLRIIKIKEGNKIITLLVKTKTGPSKKDNLSTYGINKLAINPETLDIYGIKNSSNKNEPYIIEYKDNFRGLEVNSKPYEIAFKTKLKKYFQEVYSKQNLNKTKLEMKKFIKKNKKLFERKPIKPKAL